MSISPTRCLRPRQGPSVGGIIAYSSHNATAVRPEANRVGAYLAGGAVLTAQPLVQVREHALTHDGVIHRARQRLKMGHVRR